MQQVSYINPNSINQGSVFIGSSRGELLEWLNGPILQLGISKIEQCGSGAVYCQVLDSIYCDLPLSKVNFSAKHEFEYVKNYKILQTAFDQHKIPNYIPVERLMKCKFQDNIEFLQWMKKYWDAHFHNMDYDAPSRRSGSTGLKPRPKSTRSPPIVQKPIKQNAPPPTTQSNTRSKPTIHAETQEQLEIATKERDFYFGKLRDMEILLDSWEQDPIDGQEMIQKLRHVLYKVEDGFEVPE